MTRTPLVAANWKMHGQTAGIQALLEDLKQQLGKGSGVEVAICPPSLYIPQVGELLQNTDIKLGAQNVHTEQEGAYTGEISARMLQDFSCDYVIVGHSERRQLFGETDTVIAAKFAAVQQEGLVPILCVGETLEQRESGETDAIIAQQLAAVLDGQGIEVSSKAVIAYEPVWAIGTGLTASPEMAQEVHGKIRRQLAEKDAAIADSIRLLYGGSIKAANAEALFAQPDIDGGLVGGASLKADEFSRICQAI